MNTMSAKIKQFFSKNRNNILFVVLFIGLLYIDNSFAAESSGATGVTKTKTEDDIYNTLITRGNILFATGGVIRGILTQFVGLFLQPGWTNGSLIGLDAHLKNLWIMVSNVVYFIFAFILIAIAFKNIVGQGKDSYEMKTALPHLIVGILIVPFSWFIVQFVLSISALLTVSSLSLPWDTFKTSMSDNTVLTEKVIPTNCSIDIDALVGGGKTSESSNSISTENKMSGFTCDGSKTSIGEIMSNGNSLFSIMTVYSYGIMKIERYGTLYVNQIKDAKNIGSLAVNMLFNIVFLLRFVILLIALVMAMFSRGVVLWLFTIFSPLFGLLYFFNGKVPSSLKSLEKIGFKHFLGLAMVPVYVALALSFGLLFSFVATQGLSNGVQSTGGNELKDNKITIAGSTLTISGSFLSSNSGDTGKNVVGGILSGGAGAVSQLVINLIALAILWMSVMAALKSSDITASVVQPIAAFGESIGKTAMKLPQYAPIFPGGMSASGMRSASSTLSGQIDSHFAGKGTKVGQEFAKGLGIGDEKINKLQDLQNKASINNDENAKAAYFKENITATGDLTKRNKNHIEQLTKNIERIDFGTKEEKEKLIKDLKAQEGKPQEYAKALSEIYKKIKSSDKSLDSKEEIIEFAANGTIGGNKNPETKSSTSSLPSGIKTIKDDNGKITNITVNNNNLGVNNGKITHDGDLDKLIKGLEINKKTYSTDSLNNDLKELGISDKKQIEEIFKKLDIKRPESK
ncbi:MAG: hypothetical protein PHR68_00865 [Candidatus Gracilibacteria bacterium]|nr:hypothetical protein [Candidatus Gracilibacteria bacterium]